MQLFRSLKILCLVGCALGATIASAGDPVAGASGSKSTGGSVHPFCISCHGQG